MLAQVTTTAPNALWIVIGIIAVIIIVVVAMRQRSNRLRNQFGAEYDRAVVQTGSRKDAEAELATRQKRVKGFNLKQLTPGARERYLEEWRVVQARFVDDPAAAISDADRLVINVMRDRGYPMEDFESRAQDLSVDHADDVLHYRAAHAISLKNDRSEASTEELRQAIVHYRALYQQLLGVDQVGAAGQPSS